MIVLAVDTSTRTGSLALLRKRDVIAGPVVLPEGPHSVHLLGGAEVLCRSVAVSLADVELFAVCSGPGSFTGLRVGITTVMAWGESYGRPLTAVSSLEAIAASAPPGAGDLIAAVLDARRGQVFGGLYERESEDPLRWRERIGTILGAPGEVLARIAAGLGGRVPVFSTPTPEILGAAIANSALSGARILQVSSVLSPAVGWLGYQRATRGEAVDALHLEANYVRRPDAEVNWKAS